MLKVEWPQVWISNDSHSALSPCLLPSNSSPCGKPENINTEALTPRKRLCVCVYVCQGVFVLLCPIFQLEEKIFLSHAKNMQSNMADVDCSPLVRSSFEYVEGLSRVESAHMDQRRKFNVSELICLPKSIQSSGVVRHLCNVTHICCQFHVKFEAVYSQCDHIWNHCHWTIRIVIVMFQWVSSLKRKKFFCFGEENACRTRWHGESLNLSSTVGALSKEAVRIGFVWFWWIRLCSYCLGPCSTVKDWTCWFWSSRTWLRRFSCRF